MQQHTLFFNDKDPTKRRFSIERVLADAYSHTKKIPFYYLVRRARRDGERYGRRYCFWTVESQKKNPKLRQGKINEVIEAIFEIVAAEA